MKKINAYIDKGFKSILIIIVSVVMANNVLAAGFWQDIQERGTLRCAAPIYPPLNIKDAKTGKYSGVYLDMCREFAEKYIGVEVEYVDTTWDNVVAGLQAGKWDISPALNRKPKRALAINYSIPASYSEINMLFNPKNPKLESITSDLNTIDKKGITIGLVSGTAQDHSVTRKIKNAKIIRLPSIDEVRLALLSRRIDAIFDEVDTNRIFALQHPEKFTTLSHSPSFQKQGIGFGLPSSTSWSEVQVLNIYIEEKVALGQVEDLFTFYSKKIIEDSK